MHIGLQIQGLLHLLANRASKLEHARSRPENQTLEMGAAIDWVELITPETVDKAIPWIIREIRKGRITGGLRRNDDRWAPEMGPQDMGYAGGMQWRPFFAHLEDWIEAERPNLMSLTTFQVAEQMNAWDEKLGIAQTGKTYEEKNVVHDFGDGWTIQQVKTSNDLKVEGEKMGHCVGGYCDSVHSGKSYIYSLRDPKNEPHVTMEMSQPFDQNFVFDQVKGKSNKAPKAEYSGYIYEWAVANGIDGDAFKKLVGETEDGESFKDRVIDSAEDYADNSESLGDYISDYESQYQSGDTTYAYLVKQGLPDLVYEEVRVTLGNQADAFMGWLVDQPAYEQLQIQWNEGMWSYATYSREDTEKAYAQEFGETEPEEERELSGDVKPSEALSWDDDVTLDESYIEDHWNGDRRSYFTDLAIEFGAPRSQEDDDDEGFDEAVSRVKDALDDVMLGNIQKAREKWFTSFSRTALPRLVREFQESGESGTSYTNWQPTRRRYYNDPQLELPFNARRSLLEARQILETFDA